ncbi:MAG: cation-translocating P-type ATPase C-terminal domain-containing protein [Polyangiaceae bacterium]
MLAGAIAALFASPGAEVGTVPLPLTALQLLWINFLGDGPPALALVLDRHAGVMTRPPRRASGGAFDRASLRYIGFGGAVNGALGAALWFGLPLWGLASAAAQTALFLFSSIAKLLSVFAAREVGSAAHAKEAKRRPNVVLGLVIVASVALQVSTALFAPLSAALGLGGGDRGSCFAVVAVATVINSLALWLLARRA